MNFEFEYIKIFIFLQIDEFKLKNIVRYLPEEMAEYIYETGDEKTIAIAIENYLQLGIVSNLKQNNQYENQKQFI